MRLTIAIPTIVGREEQFERLKAHLEKQKKQYELQDGYGWVVNGESEIIFEKDNKELSIGAKRQNLLIRANGEYIVIIDDDDWIPDNYLATIMPLLTGVDCIGYLEECNIGGQKRRSIFSLAFTQWADNAAGYDHVRTPFYKSPMKTAIARQVGFQDIRYGEDVAFAREVYPLLKTETFINEVMYYYSPVFDGDFNGRYGIK